MNTEENYTAEEYFNEGAISHNKRYPQINNEAPNEIYHGQWIAGEEEEDPEILTMIQRGNKLIAGGITNAGLIEKYEHKIDPYFSLDENMQNFIETIREEIRS